MRRKPIGHSAAPNTGIAGGEHVNIGIADNDGFFRAAAALFPQSVHTLRVRLFGRKAVSPVNLEEKIAQAQRLDDPPRWVHRLVAEHRQPQRQAVLMRRNLLQERQNSVVYMRVIERVLAVVEQKVFQTTGENRRILW